MDQLAQLRRETILLTLYCFNLCGKYKTQFEEDILLNLSYYRQFVSNGDIYSIKVPREFEDIINRWKIFVAHKYFTFTCEAGLSTFLYSLNTHKSGLTLKEFFDLVDKKKLLRILSDFTNIKYTNKTLYNIRINIIMENILKLFKLNKSNIKK